MALARLVLAWFLVSGWFVLWELGEARLWKGRAGPRRGLLRLYLTEALLVTLFAALWFASLGAGGWVLLFLVLGLLMEAPARFRDDARDARALPRTFDSGKARWLRIGLGVVRIIGAGGILAWQL